MSQLNRPKLLKLNCDLETLKQVVDTNEKQRFTLINEHNAASSSGVTANGEPSGAGETIEGTWWIRANQGHSINVRLAAAAHAFSPPFYWFP